MKVKMRYEPGVAINDFCNQDIKSPEITIKRPVSVPQKNPDKILRVFVHPHPPDFNSAKFIFFRDFYIEKKENKTFVVFLENINNDLISTRVDASAIEWK